MWGNFRKSLTGNNTRILFIDSEGTSATDRGTRTYDSRIFALVVLISSLFIYNTTSNIDEHGISELSLAAHLSNAITTNSNIDKDDLLSELAPKFIWLLRDFTLEKTHPETGLEISSKEYLEICLRKKISGKNSSDNNLIRNNIIKYFPERDCITLVRPVEAESDLQKLNDIPFDKLKLNFKLEFKTLKDKIFKETLPKKFNGKKLNGPTLAYLIVEFVNTINSGNIPNINSSWDSVINKDVKDYYDKAINFYKHKTGKLNKQIYEQEDLIKYLYDYKLDSLTMTMCKDLIKSEFKEINKKIFDNYYTSKLIINDNELNIDFNNFITNYQKSDKSKGVNKLQILIDNLIINEKIILEYLVNTLNRENESKLFKVDKELREAQSSLDDLEILNQNLIQINSTNESRVSILFDFFLLDQEFRKKLRNGSEAYR